MTATDEKASGFAHHSCFDSLKKLKKLEHEIENIKRATLNGIAQVQMSVEISNPVCQLIESKGALQEGRGPLSHLTNRFQKGE